MFINIFMEYYFIFLKKMAGQNRKTTRNGQTANFVFMRAATENVTVHAIVYFIDFLHLKKKTFIENKTSTQTALWKEQETRLCCKEIWQEYGTFLRDIAKQKNGTALSTGTALNYLGQPKETVGITLKR